MYDRKKANSEMKKGGVWNPRSDAKGSLLEQ
jgi:hypothetical protein